MIHFTYTRETWLEDKHALNYEEVKVSLCILYSNAIDAIGTFNRSGLSPTNFVLALLEFEHAVLHSFSQCCHSPKDIMGGEGWGRETLIN